MRKPQSGQDRDMVPVNCRSTVRENPRDPCARLRKRSSAKHLEEEMTKAAWGTAGQPSNRS